MTAAARELEADFGARQPEMLEELVTLASQNSGSENLEGIARMADLLADRFGELGPVERLPLGAYTDVGADGGEVTHNVGDLLRVTLRPDAPRRVLLVGHYDTVFPVDHHFQTVTRLDDERLRGPGVADLKGGLVAMRHALLVLEQRALIAELGIDILLNPDEELGSPGSTPVLVDAARSAEVGLIYEPALPDGGLVSTRKGSGTYTFVVRGRAAHAGRDHHLGRNAIAAAARLIDALDELNGQRPDCTVNVGVVSGGTATNIVPDLAIVRINVRVATVADADWFDTRLRALATDAGQSDGITVETLGGFGRRPKEVTPELEALLERIRAAGASFGLELTWGPSGGVSDGNDLAAAGLVNVDTMGVHGGAIHSDQEWMRISSLPERAALTAVTLVELATAPLDPRS